ncbi:MAG: phosphoribosyltransferase [Acidimicrobiales bacterium]
MPSWVFQDRAEAGRALAALLEVAAAHRESVVLALPRGGVPVAAPIAATLGAPLDVLAVRKLGVPGHEELAMGAIAEGGVRVLNEDVVTQLGINQGVVDEATRHEELRLAEQQRRFRGGLAPPARTGRLVVVVDDGLATGSTMHAAIASCRAVGVAGLIVAVPVGAPSTVAFLATMVEQVICPYQPARLRAVGSAYRDFAAVSDEEVVALLAAARGPR